MNLRGKALGEHVEASLGTDKTAAQIAAAAGYRHVERCAQNLARARYAYLANRLMARHQIDLVNAPEPEPEAEPAEPKGTRRPRRTAEELLDELRDMSECGLTFEQAAERLGVKPHTLRCDAHSKGLTDDVRALFPTWFRPKISNADLMARLVELAEAGESYEQAAKAVGYKPQSLTQRLKYKGGLQQARALFGTSLWRKDVA